MPKNKQGTHDEFFKVTFSQKRIAEGYIRHFIDPAILKKLDLPKLQLEPTSYITPALKKYFSDIVYTCPYKNQKLIITFLFEHKSRPVKYPHIQLLRYKLEIWENNIKNSEPLQIVLPLIFYHGQENWNYKSIPEYFGKVDQPLLEYLPDFKYHLLNISKWSDEQIIQLHEAFLVNTLLVFKHIWDEKYIIHNINKLLVQLEDHIGTYQGKNFLDSIIVYLFTNSNFDQQTAEFMIDQMEKSIQGEARTTYSRIVEYGIEKGFERGREEGRKQGREEGKKEGREEGIHEGMLEKATVTIKNLYSRGFSTQEISEIVSVDPVKVEEIITDIQKVKSSEI